MAFFAALLPDDPWLRGAILVAAALAVLSAALMLQVLLLSELSARRHRRRAAFEARWRPRLAAASIGGAAFDGAASDGSPPPPAEQAWFLMAWCQMQHRLRGAAHARLNAFLRSLGLDVAALQLLQARDASLQLLGLASLRHLADPAHWHAIQALLHDPRPIHSLAAAEALVAIDPGRAMEAIIPLAMARRDWARARIEMLARRAGSAAVSPPLLAALHAPVQVGARRSRLLELIPLGDPHALLPWAVDALGRPSEDVEAAAALAVLARVGDPRHRGLVVDRLESPDAAVRLASVLALQAQATAADVDRLAARLGDQEWSVRQAAADALAALPGLDGPALDAIRSRVADRYGRDALDRAIAERAR